MFWEVFSPIPKIKFVILYCITIMWICITVIAICQPWWYKTITSALGRPRQEDLELKISLGYTVRTCLKNKKINKNKQPSKKQTKLILFPFLTHLIFVWYMCMYVCVFLLLKEEILHNTKKYKVLLFIHLILLPLLPGPTHTTPHLMAEITCLIFLVYVFNEYLLTYSYFHSY
jgi:hypothetical protein